MSDKTFDYENLSVENVIAEIKADVEEKGSLNITELANESIPQSGFLTAIAEVVGADPFAFVMKSSYKNSISEVRVELNPTLLMAALPVEHQSKVRALAVLIQKDSTSSKNPEFQAFKRLICHELTKAILVESKGAVQLEWDENFGTDVKFCHAHTSDAKKAAIEEQREAREAARTGGQRVQQLRSKFRRPRS